MISEAHSYLLISFLSFFFSIFIFMFAEDSSYLYIKVLHITCSIAWMAGMLYLPRLFVYHAQQSTGSPESEIFKIMERRLLKTIMNPAMILTWASGLWIAWKHYNFYGGWLHSKIFLVLLLSGLHGFFLVSLRHFGQDKNRRSHVFWRIMNELPTLIMILIVFLVVLKPF